MIDPKQPLARMFSKDYRWRQFEEPVLVLGTFKFTRQTMYTELGNGHTVAAKKVTATFNYLGVTSIYGILRIPMVDWARIEGFGEACLRILLDLMLWNAVPTEKIDKWVVTELRGQKLVQWTAICAQAAKKVRKRGRHQAA